MSELIAPDIIIFSIVFQWATRVRLRFVGVPVFSTNGQTLLGGGAS